MEEALGRRRPSHESVPGETPSLTHVGRRRRRRRQQQQAGCSAVSVGPILSGYFGAWLLLTLEARASLSRA